MSKAKPRLKENLEAKLDRLIRESIGRGPENYTPEQWNSLRENSRVTLLYPGKFVAYRPHYEGEGSLRRLKRCEVLAISGTLMGLHKLTSKLPEEQRKLFMVCYVLRPDEVAFV